MSQLQSRWLTSALMFAGLACNVFAVDGVILIDQNRALAGNITPGDAPGFPITISQPGSYRLQGNLTVSGLVNGIEITSSHVVIDLNGFNISCQCEFGNSSNHNAIVGVGALRSISIRNGTIALTGNEANAAVINLNSQTQVNIQDMSVDGSILAGPFSIVRRNTCRFLQVSCPSVILENVIITNLNENHGTGADNCVAWHNRSLFDAAEIRQ